MFLRADFAGKASPSLSDVEFNNNFAVANGGAIYVWATLNDKSNPTMKRATFFPNSADRGGATFTDAGSQGGNADVSIENSSFNANDASLGNSVGAKGGAIYNDGVGGSAAITLTHATFSGNLANGANHFGGALMNTGSGANAHVVNTIFWANQAAGSPEILNSGGAAATIQTSIVAGGCPPNSTCTGLITTDPALAALADNGRFISTMSIASTGAAFDAAEDVGCTVTDQRGTPRPQDAHCDIGAFEVVQPHLCHVNHSASGANDGLAWSSAYANLQSALNDSSCNEIGVARGLYKPTAGTDVAASFKIRPGLQVYGGFTGNETTRGHAEPGTNRSILAGEVDGNDITDADGVVTNAPDANKIVGNNSRIVVCMNGTTAAGSIGAETLLNGFTITAGVGSDLENITNTIGGGLYCNGNGRGHACKPTLSRLTFSGNKAQFGGALFLRGESGGVSNPDISASTFTGNYAGLGAAIYNYGFGGTASPRITHSTFSKNKSGLGAAMVSDGRNTGGVSKPIISNSTFVGNTAGTGVIYNVVASGGMTEAKFDNVIPWNPGAAEVSDYNAGSSTVIKNSMIEGGRPSAQATCQDVSATDPLLGPLQDNGGATWTHLPGPNGSAIDAANPALCGDAPFDVDKRAVARPQGPVCDIGDGRLDYGNERIVEAYSSFQPIAHGTLSPDIQWIADPGYNRERGPAEFVGIRAHLEY